MLEFHFISLFSAHVAISQSAHVYSECSNKGICDRRLGSCQCFVGYEGSACHRASCPSNVISGVVCSGHGICVSIGELAAIYGGNIYSLWDKDATMGCYCDPNYHGPDCSYRTCPVGYDPVYLELPYLSPRHFNFSYIIYSSSATANLTGQYAIAFFDVYGKEWISAPIDVDASCAVVASALETLPNHVVKLRSVRCLRWPNFHDVTPQNEPGVPYPNPYFGFKYTLSLPSLPGRLKQPEIRMNLDGNRPTVDMANNDAGAEINWRVYSNGFHGEDIDYVANHCTGVLVSLAGGAAFDYVTDLSNLEMRLLQRCLGDADGDLHTSSSMGSATGNSFDWDYGSAIHPHLVKFVDTTSPQYSDLCVPDPRPNATRSDERGFASLCTIDATPPGFYAALYFDAVTSVFRIYTQASAFYSPSTQFAVFTTEGTLVMTSRHSKVYSDVKGGPYSKKIFTTNSSSVYPNYIGNFDCESLGHSMCKVQ